MRPRPWISKYRAFRSHVKIPFMKLVDFEDVRAIWQIALFAIGLGCKLHCFVDSKVFSYGLTSHLVSFHIHIVVPCS